MKATRNNVLVSMELLANGGCVVTVEHRGKRVQERVSNVGISELAIAEIIYNLNFATLLAC